MHHRGAMLSDCIEEWRQSNPSLNLTCPVSLFASPQYHLHVAMWPQAGALYTQYLDQYSQDQVAIKGRQDLISSLCQLQWTMP